MDKHSTGGVGDKTSLIAAPIAAAAGVVVPMISGRALGHTGGTLDKLEAIPGFRTDLTIDEFRAQLQQHGLASSGKPSRSRPADGKLYSLRDATATVESIPLIASSIMSKKIAVGLDALVLDVKVGSGAFMKKQVEARRLAQMMVGIGRRMDMRVQALITDMNQPLGYAVGNALEVMEVSQTLQNAGPADLTQLSHRTGGPHDPLGQDHQDPGRSSRTRPDQAARRIRHTRSSKTSSRRRAETRRCSSGSNCCPTRQGLARLLLLARDLSALSMPRLIGLASSMIGAGRDTKEDAIDPAVGVILEVKVGQRVDAGGILCRLYYTNEERVEDAAQLVEDAFRISASAPEPRALILEMVG